jgi:D-proline reductase (dithiol) PrdB
MSGDAPMRSFAANLPAPEFADAAFVTPVPLAEAKVAIVTSAALHRANDEAFGQDDASYRVIPRDARDLVLGHWSPNFDRAGFTADLNVVFPIDRLEELAERGVIGSVADQHYSFAGNQPDDVATIIHDSGPAAAAALKADGVDVVLLTPV